MRFYARWNLRKQTRETKYVCAQCCGLSKEQGEEFSPYFLCGGQQTSHTALGGAVQYIWVLWPATMPTLLTDNISQLPDRYVLCKYCEPRFVTRCLTLPHIYNPNDHPRPVIPCKPSCFDSFISSGLGCRSIVIVESIILKAFDFHSSFGTVLACRSASVIEKQSYWHDHSTITPLAVFILSQCAFLRGKCHGTRSMHTPPFRTDGSSFCARDAARQRHC